MISLPRLALSVALLLPLVAWSAPASFAAKYVTAAPNVASAAVLPTGGPSAAALPAVRDIDFAGLARGLLKRHQLEESIASTFDFDQFLKGEFIYMRLGLFDLHMEIASARDKQSADEFKDVAEALLGLQEVWLNTTQPISKDQTQARQELDELKAFVKRLRGAAIANAAKGSERGDLYGLLAAGDGVRDIAESFASFMASGACLGQDREVRRETMVVVPDRRSYLQFVSLAGWLRPELQDVFWDEGVSTWTNCYIDDYRFMALRLPAGDGSSDSHLKKGVSLNARTSNGLQQQLAQLSALSLVDNYFGENVPPALAGGLSVMLTVDLYGECNTKVDGDLSERRTEAYELFVPGGNPNGGILPPNLADSRWRKRQGSRFFVGVLKAAQKAGKKEKKRAKNKARHFELQNDDKNKRMVVSGPFMGANATDLSSLPDPFQGDKDEFLRSYRTSFLHWLRTASMGKEDPSKEAFAQWLKALAAPEDDQNLETITAEVFGDRPMTDSEVSKESLEGAFLTWISKS